MDTNDQQDVDLNNEEVLDLDLEGDKPKEEPKDEKPKEEPEARVARLKRQYERELKKLSKTDEKPESKEKATKSGEVGYAEKAFLYATGIKGGEEVALVQEFMANTGKSLEDVVDSKFFQAELKEMRDSKASSDAVPKGSKRSTSTTKDSVDYWLAKGELPENTSENQELRRKVVNARYDRESQTNKFSGSPTGSIMRQSQQKK